MAQKGETLVEVKDLCKNFGVTIALSHVDFVVKTGEIRGLIGENGSGKSTVSSIRLLLTLLCVSLNLSLAKLVMRHIYALSILQLTIQQSPPMTMPASCRTIDIL